MDVKIKTVKTSSILCKIIITDINDVEIWDSGDIIWFHETGQLQNADSMNGLMNQQKLMNPDWNFVETINEFE
jgi:hypothetical protein